MTDTVVVAVGESSHLSDAVYVAAYEARLRGGRLRLVHALPPADPGTEAQRLLRAADDQVCQAYPSLPRTTVVQTGEVHEVLAAESQNASLLVIGRRHGPLPAERTVTLADRLIADVACPMIVAMGGGQLVGPVIAAVDDTPSAAAVLDFACRDAALRGAPLQVLHAIVGPMWAAVRRLSRPVDGEPGSVLAEALSRMQTLYPTVPVSLTMSERPAHGVLLDATRDAQLLAVGGDTDGFFPHLGSTRHVMLRHARCPVAFVPRWARTDPTGVPEAAAGVRYAASMVRL